MRELGEGDLEAPRLSPAPGEIAVISAPTVCRVSQCGLSTPIPAAAAADRSSSS